MPKKIKPAAHRRSRQFSLDPERLPDRSRPAWAATRDFFRAARAIQSAAVAKADEVRSDDDLVDDAKRRRIGEIRKAASSEIASAAAKNRETIEQVQGAIDVAVAELVDVDPFAVPRINTQALTSSDIELARLTRLSIEAMNRVSRQLGRAEVDRRLDRVLEDASGGELLALYAWLSDNRDEAQIAEFESYGVARVARDGSEPQREVLRLQIEEAQERRAEGKLNDSARLELDHRDALDAVKLMVEAVVGDATAVEFLSQQRSPGLATAEIQLGAELSGRE